MALPLSEIIGGALPRAGNRKRTEEARRRANYRESIETLIAEGARASH